jgi:hypothetical protein
VLVGLAAGSVRSLRGEATTAAATAIVVLTTGYSDDGGMLAARLLDVGIGVAVGMLVNLLVWPPLRDRGAAHQIDVIDDRIGELLVEIAAGLRGDQPPTDEWIARTEALDDDIDEGRRVLGQARESGRLNPRPELAELDPDGRNWPVHGALIVNLRNILESLDVVATVQPVEVPSRPPASPSREARRTAPSRR